MYKYVLVLVDIGKLGTKTFSYLVPDELKDKIKIGQALLVPFGKNRKIKAYVVGFSNYLENGIKAKYISEILESEPLFSLEYLKLLEYVANYYFCDIQTVLKTALPQKFFEKNLKKYRKPNIENKIFNVGKKEDNILSNAQQKVLEDIEKIKPKNALIYGVTGSGKTEVYFKLIEKTIKEGKNVMFLAPEIALVSQLTIRTMERFGVDSCAIWHSSITEAEKYEVWQKLRKNEIKILFGARSCVFAPISNLGLIIIDEEHDSSYKQSMPNPRYNATVVAQKLAELHGANVVAGSATPDINSYYRAKNSNSLFELKERFNNQAMPKVVVVDMKSERIDGNFGIFSRTLIKNIEDTILGNKQVILLINRRGFSTYTQCMSCGKVIECEKCAVPLVYHSKDNSHKCHWCNREIKNLTKCPDCGEENLENFGVGVQRVEEIAKKFFPEAKIARLDSDSLTKKNEHIEILNAFKNGDIDILIGTQMIAKGLDNPNVTLVGVINADLSFNLPDYRSSERGFSILTQVAGRSGRGEDLGKVIFQSYNPENIALLNAQAQDYEAFYENEIEMREQFDYPPFMKIVRIILSSKNEFRAERASLEIAEKMKQYIETQSLSEKIIVLGPSVCVLEKIKGEYRYNILIKNALEDKGHEIILRFLRTVILPNDIKMVVDVDPVDII
ncbi:MAG: primosomal protein N' [Cyanobacteria bacterium SIG30]|nr:primosomal protein N' [Cyanobacteria bacterium SIG30]